MMSGTERWLITRSQYRDSVFSCVRPSMGSMMMCGWVRMNSLMRGIVSLKALDSMVSTMLSLERLISAYGPIFIVDRL
ncbi:hypothetical protein DF196_08250 [Bifidobacterium callitrichidarum]|uniref:Uncharacterized protein n=1 Tax=Bifidobacterium callitrichidarum TaxID=2052941 RepID=A0A2U2N6M6_9BIFI|nr:hypothetical protein DF196_08250 [Bifidobacterium callitrichidarum]